MSALIVAVLLMSNLRSDFSLEMDGWTEDKSDEKENQPARKKLKLSLKKKSKPEGGSRWQHLTAAEQEELFVKHVPKNTAASTTWAVTNFQDWKRSRNESLSDGEPVPEELLYSSDPKLLCKWLSLFADETRKKNSTPYPPKSLYILLAGVLRHMRSLNKDCPNFLDTEKKSLTNFMPALTTLSDSCAQMDLVRLLNTRKCSLKRKKPCFGTRKF